MSVMMTLSFQPQGLAATRPQSANPASNSSNQADHGSQSDTGAAVNVWRTQSFAQAMQTSGTVSTQPQRPYDGSGTASASATSGPLVGAGNTPVASQNPAQMHMLFSLSRDFAMHSATTAPPAPAQPRSATQSAPVQTIPHLAAGQRAIIAADGHLTPHANPALIDVFQQAIEKNNEWNRVRMSAPPNPAGFTGSVEPGANGRGPITQATERVVRDHLQQEHDVDLQALPVKQMMIEDLIDANEQLVLMRGILEKIVDEVGARSGRPPSQVDRLRFVRESEVLARGFLSDMIQHFASSQRAD